MFAVNGLRAALRSGFAQALIFYHAHGRRRGLRRRLSKHARVGYRMTVVSSWAASV